MYRPIQTNSLSDLDPPDRPFDNDTMPPFRAATVAARKMHARRTQWNEYLLSTSFELDDVVFDGALTFKLRWAPAAPEGEVINCVQASSDGGWPGNDSGRQG